MVDAAPDEFEAFLMGYPPEVRAISNRLRAVVRKAAPRVQETLYARHNNVGYSLSGKMRDTYCYICLLHDYVRLGFYYGTRLPDPERLLVGEGKRMRHVKVRSLSEADNPALAALVMAAGIAADGRR